MCKVAKDADHLLLVHRGLQGRSEDSMYMEVVKEQLPFFRQIAQDSNDYLAVFQNKSAHLSPQADIVSQQCQDDLNSIILNAEASIAVIIGFLTRSGHAIS